MLDSNDKKEIREIIKEETSPLRADVAILKQDVAVLKKDVLSLKDEQLKQGILMEDMGHKIDLILENVIMNNNRTKDYTEVKDKVYEDHEFRIRALESSFKEKIQAKAI